ncbi:MAG: hypothetical protein VKO00_10400 [Cyanobacteriota bacterium]|nr:hypothetical protein [Cyanobacteriota bacterium]
MAVLLAGSCRQPNGEERKAAQSAAAPIAFLGLIDYLLGPATSTAPHRADRTAAAGGCRWLSIQRRHFRELLDMAPVLETLIMRQLALAQRQTDPAER